MNINNQNTKENQRDCNKTVYVYLTLNLGYDLCK